MQVSDILAKKGTRVVTVRSDISIATALQKLVLERIGALVVSDDGEHVDGILSERDIVRALAAEGAELLRADRRVADLMTRSVRVCAPSDSIKHVMDTMTRYRVRHLPVVEGGKLVGLVSIGDVVKNRLDELELEANVLRDAWIASH